MKEGRLGEKKEHLFQCGRKRNFNIKDKTLNNIYIWGDFIVLLFKRTVKVYKCYFPATTFFKTVFSKFWKFSADLVELYYV